MGALGSEICWKLCWSLLCSLNPLGKNCSILLLVLFFFVRISSSKRNRNILYFIDLHVHLSFRSRYIVFSSCDYFVCCVSVCFLVQAIWVLAINSDFLISISLLPDVVNLWYFKLRFMLDQIVCDIIELQKYRDYENRVCVHNYFHAWCLSQFRSRVFQSLIESLLMCPYIYH